MLLELLAQGIAVKAQDLSRANLVTARRRQRQLNEGTLDLFQNTVVQARRRNAIGLVGEVGKDVQAGTFHAICARVLRRDGEAIGIDRHFVIYDTDDQMSVIKAICADQQIDPKQFRTVLGHLPTGVCVVTGVNRNGDKWGITIGSVSMVGNRAADSSNFVNASCRISADKVRSASVSGVPYWIVWISVIAGSWLMASVFIERTKHMSSTMLAV